MHMLRFVYAKKINNEQISSHTIHVGIGKGAMHVRQCYVDDVLFTISTNLQLKHLHKACQFIDLP
jgi:hypothetical protein